MPPLRRASRDQRHPWPEGTLLVTKRWFSPEIDVRSLTGHIVRTIHPGLDDPTPYLGRDGKLLLVDGDAELWDARPGRRVARLRTRDTDAEGGAMAEYDSAWKEALVLEGRDPGGPAATVAAEAPAMEPVCGDRPEGSR